MSKTELLAELTANGNVGTFRRTPSWEKAFNFYNLTNHPKLQPNCTTCFRKVLGWLRS